MSYTQFVTKWVIRSVAVLTVGLFLTGLTAAAHRVQSSFPPPVQLSFGAGGGSNPVMKIDSKGDIDVAWIGSSIFFSRSSDGGAVFSNPKEVQALATSASDLQMSLDGQDHINMVWTTPEGQFFSRSTDNGFTFSAPLNLSSNPGVGTQPNSFQMLAEPGGAIDLFWIHLELRNTINGFFSRSTDGGVTFSSPVVAVSVHPGLFLPNFDDRIQPLLGSKGQIYAFLTRREEHANTNPCVVTFVRSLDQGGTFSSPLDISAPLGTIPPCSAATPTVDERGNIDVALTYSVAGPATPSPLQNVTFRRSTDEGASFSAPVTVSAAPQFFFTSSARISTDFGKNIYIAWSSTDSIGGPPATFIAQSDNGGASFSTPRILSGFGNSPALAVDVRGNVNVAWSDSILSGSPQTPDIFFSRSTGSGKIFPNPVNASNSPGESDVVSAILLNHRGDAYLLWQANVPNLPSQVFFDRIPASFFQQSDFRVNVFPDFVNVVQGEILQFSVVGHDLDDVKDASLICSPVPSSSPTLDTALYFAALATCTFNPSSLSVGRAHSRANLTVTVPPNLAPGSYFLGVNAVGDSTANTQTVRMNVTAP